MKKPLLILAISLIANVALLAVFRSRSSPRETNTGTVSPNLSAGPAGSSSRPTASDAAAVSPANFAPSDNAYIDQEIQSQIARMREQGVPEQLIQRAVQSRLIAKYQARLAELFGVNDDVPPFWDTSSTLSSILQDPENRAAMQALSREMQDAMVELFGPTFQFNTLAESQVASLRLQYGNLSMDTIRRIMEISSDYSRRQQDALESGSIINMLPEEREAYNRLQVERDNAIRNALTPEEYREYELNSSSSANTLRSRLTAFNPTEEEFLAMFEIQKAFDEQYPSSTITMTTAERMERSQAQQALDDQFVMVLSPERAEDFRLTTQGSGQTVARLVTRLGLPTSAVRDVLQVQSTTQEQANALRQNGSLDPQARNQQLSALAAQASNQLTDLLGPVGFEAYQTYGGNWIESLVPTAQSGRGAPIPTSAR